jgi:hypothetical protein
MGKLTPTSIRGIPESLRDSIIPLVAVVCFFQFPSSAKAQTAPTSPGIAPNSSTYSPDGTAPEKEKKQPLPDGDNSSDPSTDLDDSDSGLDDFSADPSTRNDQDTPWFTTTTLDTIAPRHPGIVPVFLFPAHSSDSPREHSRERAPPTPA